MLKSFAIVCLFLFSPSSLLTACSPPASSNQVVIYTSVDQPFSEPILNRFEAETGIDVRAIYDVEAAKTTGLVNRLIAEKERPQADVFWNSEILQTIRLQQEGVLQPYNSPLAADIPETFLDADGFWSSNAGRARVMLVNTDLVADPSTIDSLDDLVDPIWPGHQIGIAYPLFGTTATHAAALYELLGPQAARAYFQSLADHKVRVVDGNAAVRDLVANGSLAFGITDTDDACGAVARGAPVTLVFPDQAGSGTLTIPSTVALIAGAPNIREGQALIDFLLRPETEQALLDAEYSHIPIHANLRADDECIGDQVIKSMEVDYLAVFRYFELAQVELREIFIQ